MRAPRVALVVLLAVGLWPYAYVLGLHPVSRDAVQWITRSAVWSGGWPAWVFGSSHFIGWRPLTALSFTANSVLGAAPLPYRATDLAVHVACAAALYAVHRRLLPRGSAWGGVAGAALLLVHPVAGIVVPHLARRAYPLSTLLALLAALAVGSGRRWLAAALVGASALAHEAGFVAGPAVALLAALRAPGTARERLLVGAPALGAAAALAVLRALVLRGAGGYDVEGGARWASILAASVTGILGLEPMRTGAGDVPGAVVVAVALAAAAGLGALLLRDRDDEIRTVAAFAGAWLVGIVLVYVPQGVFFPRQLYVPVAAWALLVGVAVSAAAASTGWRRALPAGAAVLAFAAAGWQSPVLRGPDPVQVACWRAHDALVRDMERDLAGLPRRTVVDAVLPHHRRPSFEALRAREDGRGRFAGRQGTALVAATSGIRFGEVVLYVVDAPVEAPVARLDGDAVVLPPQIELIGADAVDVRRDADGTVVRFPAPDGGRPRVRYIHDGVRGTLRP